jgi:hypothetical protein
MRTAYSGRAAAYEKKGELDKALADHDMVMLFYGIEAEILNELQSPERGKFLGEFARACRARGNCLEVLGRSEAAASNRARADRLEAEVKKLDTDSRQAKETATTAIKVTNGWTQPVTLIVAGTPYRFEIGEQKSIPAPTGTVAYEMLTGGYRASGVFEAGKAYRIRVTP